MSQLMLLDDRVQDLARRRSSIYAALSLLCLDIAMSLKYNILLTYSFTRYIAIMSSTTELISMQLSS
jgi:hypothetical protein